MNIPTLYLWKWCVAVCVAVCVAGCAAECVCNCSLRQDGIPGRRRSNLTYLRLPKFRSVLQFVTVCCSVVQCGAVCCSVLQCVAVCCSVLQCVAVCCSVYLRHRYNMSKETTSTQGSTLARPTKQHGPCWYLCLATPCFYSV